MPSISPDSAVLSNIISGRVNPECRADELIEQFYTEMTPFGGPPDEVERLDHTWQTTALVNELYLELVKVRELTSISPIEQADKAAFLGFAGHLMKRLLIHHARPLYRRVQRVPFEERSEPAISVLKLCKSWTTLYHAWRQSTPSSDP